MKSAKGASGQTKPGNFIPHRVCQHECLKPEFPGLSDWIQIDHIGLQHVAAHNTAVSADFAFKL